MFTAEDTRTDEDLDNAMTYEEWWAEFNSNACCPDAHTAALRMCGCGGSAALPSGISRLLTGEVEF